MASSIQRFKRRFKKWRNPSKRMYLSHYKLRRKASKARGRWK